MVDLPMVRGKKKIRNGKNMLICLLVTLAGSLPYPAHAEIYGSLWPITRVLEAGTFQVVMGELPAGKNMVTVHLTVKNQGDLPDWPGHCPKEADMAIEAQKYVEDMVYKDKKDIRFSNPVGLEDVLNGKTHDMTADVLVDRQSLYELLKAKQFAGYGWCEY